jgi:ureidoglycolate dehydrogenase (NAD+)
VKLVAAAALEEIMSAALARRGLTAEHARHTVDGLLFASRRGVDTHGVRLFPTYLAELDGGRSNAHPRLRWQRRRGAARLLDAGNALGMVAGRVAADAAAGLAERFGAGAVAVANSNHFGAASYYTVEMARHGMVGMAFSNSDALVAAHGGQRPILGTNPLSIAACGSGDEVFCLDMATSQVSYSQVLHRQEHGLALEHGWAVAPGGADAAERPPGSPIAALKPLGGYKGQGLGMAVEILCSLLAGMPLGHQLSHLYSPPYDEPRRVSHLFVALRIAAFTDPAAFRDRLSGWLAALRQEASPEAAAVLVAGDLEAAAARQRAVEVPLREEDWAAFAKIAAEPAGAAGAV